jgi:hypothetical protein
MAKSLVVFANALGCGATNTYVEPFGYLNCIMPIGRGWTNNPFYEDTLYWDPNPIVPGHWTWQEGRSAFGNHAFARFNNATIYDASVGIVDSLAPVDSPPHEEYWLCGWDTWDSNYRNRVIDDDPVSNPGSPSNEAFDVF